MNTAENILVVVLAAFLALFLLLGTILVIKLIELTKKMNEIADTASDIVNKAHQIADKVEDVSDMFKKTAGPLALGRYFMNIVETVAKHKNRR